jgi:hypothetical protein
LPDLPRHVWTVSVSGRPEGSFVHRADAEAFSDNLLETQSRAEGLITTPEITRTPLYRSYSGQGFARGGVLA